jgi:hypothetical protein
MGLWNRFHQNVFFSACKCGDTSQIERMLNSEPHLADMKDKRGVSGLHYAVANDHAEAVELIASYCKTVDMVEEEKNFTPLLLAATKGNARITKLLLDKGATHNAVYENELDVLAHLIDFGGDPFAKTATVTRLTTSLRGQEMTRRSKFLKKQISKRTENLKQSS